MKNPNCDCFNILNFLLIYAFYVLDEVDAALDDVNVEKFCKILKEQKNNTKTKFIITHHKITMS